MIKLETRDWVALASAAAGLAAFVLLRAPPAEKKKDAPWARSKKKGETGYYYGHQNLTGGYTDGLQASDYAMNGPRKLDSATKKAVHAWLTPSRTIAVWSAIPYPSAASTATLVHTTVRTSGSNQRA